MDPVGEGVGEECVVAAGVVEVVGGVDECGGAWGVSVGPFGPGVEVSWSVQGHVSESLQMRRRPVVMRWPAVWNKQ